MRLFCLALGALVFLLTGCATMEPGPSCLERQYNLNSRPIYNAVIEILEEEKIPIGILDSSEPRLITTEFVESKKLNQYQRYRFKIVIAELSEESTEVKIYYSQEYFDDFWKNEWIPMQSDGKAEEELFNKIETQITQINK